MTKENLDTLIVCSENGNISVSLNNNIIEFDTKPQIINGRTMVPLRAIFETLGATVDWNEKKQMVTATRNETTIKLTINNATMHVNGNAITLDSPACLVDGRTLVPVRAISEAFDIQVEWKEIKPTTPIVYDDLSANTTKPSNSVENIAVISQYTELMAATSSVICLELANCYSLFTGVKVFGDTLDGLEKLDKTAKANSYFSDFKKYVNEMINYCDNIINNSKTGSVYEKKSTEIKKYFLEMKDMNLNEKNLSKCIDWMDGIVYDLILELVVGLN